MNKVPALILGIILVGGGLAVAQQTPSMEQADVKPVEVGNKICPVSGNKVGEMGPAIKHEYNGKIYNLCCGMCPSKFDKDPTKYSKIAEDEVKDSVQK